MSHTVESCTVTKLNGGLSRLHFADEDAVSWLTNCGSWHAYEKKKLSYCWTLIGNATQGIQPLRVTPNLGSWPPFLNSGAFIILLRPLVRLSSVSCRTSDIVNAMRLTQLVDNTDRWTLFTAFDRSAWGMFRHTAMACCYTRSTFAKVGVKIHVTHF